METKSEENKLVELKEMLIGYWILENKSWDDWYEYKERNEKEWIRKEGLVILLSEEMVDLMVNKREKEVWWIFINFIWSSSVSSRAVQCSLVRLCNSVKNLVGRGGDGWKRLRVVCWVVGWLVYKCKNGLSDETIDCVVNYLVKVIEECEEMEMVKWAILTGEKWWVEMKMNSERRDRLRTALTRHSQTHSDTLVGEMDRLDLWDAERYQVGWCARWCVDNLVENEMVVIPLVKLSRDQFDVRCDDQFTCPVSSPFPVKSNVYFYEVICVTNEEIWLGWCTRKARFNHTLFGDEENSIMLEINNQCTIHHNNRQPILNPPSASPLNVFGCLLDVDNRRFEFYINGRALDCPIITHFSPKPYFATVHLFPHQHCHFNFGQCSFKFPPQNIRFTTFHEQTGGDESKYRLGVTKLFGGDFWFAHLPVDNQVSLFFDNEIQNEVNREVRRVVGDVENDRIGQWKWNVEMKKGLKWLPYIHTIIEVKGNVVRVDKVDVMAQWVGQVIEDMIDQVHKEKLLELLYPYLHLVIAQSTLTQHRSICIVLLHLIKWNHKYRTIKPIHSSVFTYLTRTLTSSPDQWTQLFVLIALANLEMSEHEKRQIEGCAKIGQIVETCRKTFEGKDVVKLIKKEHEHRIKYQLYICSQKLFKSINQNPTNVKPTTPATLNPHDLTPQLTLSPCHLSARSDWHWQSVRSVCQVSAHIYYFEVVLLTAGPMTLGWATKRTDLARTEVGGDKFSIGFDGYNRCIRHKYTSTPIESITRWEAGDVVGCMLDMASRQVTFSLNGHSIALTFTPYFSTLPYHASVSLSPHQQVYFNFGQSPFLHPPPEHIDYLDFHYAIQTGHIPSQKITDHSVQLHNVQVNNSQLLCHSTNTVHGSFKIHNIPVALTVPESSSTITTLQPLTCHLCHEASSPDRLLRFVCCANLCFCRNCLDETEIQKCPKCNPRNRSKK